MKQNLDKPKLNSSKKKPAVLASKISTIRSFEEIPDFNTAEDEVKFWQRHAISKVLLDEMPKHLYSEDYR